MSHTPLQPDESEAPRAVAGADEGAVRLPAEVLERLRQRDPAALEAFFDAYFARIFGYVRRLVADEHLAEDLTQDIFVHVHRALPNYDPARDIRPWVFTIATNKVRDFWRSRRHRDAGSEQSIDHHEGGLAEALEADAARPDAELASAERGNEVRAAVDQLPEGMRMTVLLRVYEGLSFEAIGDILERNEVAVRKRYSRALEALRQNLGPAWQV